MNQNESCPFHQLHITTGLPKDLLKDIFGDFFDRPEGLQVLVVDEQATFGLATLSEQKMKQEDGQYGSEDSDEEKENEWTEMMVKELKLNAA